MAVLLKLEGQRFGRLVVLRRGDNVGRAVGWVCRCDCGEEKRVVTTALRSGHTTSCGCRRVEVSRSSLTTHGMSNTPTFMTWKAMKTRCTNPNQRSYPRYGGRGIRVCDRWMNSFEAFLEDMGERPFPKAQIDRIDNDGDYEPANCRWSTNGQNANNRSTCRTITANGVTLNITQWAARTGIQRTTIHRRLADNWSPEDAVTTPTIRREAA